MGGKCSRFLTEPRHDVFRCSGGNMNSNNRLQLQKIPPQSLVPDPNLILDKLSSLKVLKFWKNSAQVLNFIEDHVTMDSSDRLHTEFKDVMTTICGSTKSISYLPPQSWSFKPRLIALKQILSGIFRFLGNRDESVNSVCRILVGHKGTGKTTLLLSIAWTLVCVMKTLESNSNKDTEEGLGDVLVFYRKLDDTVFRNNPGGELLGHLVRVALENWSNRERGEEIGRAFRQWLTKHSINDDNYVQKLLEFLLTHGVRIILMLDEFELSFKKPKEVGAPFIEHIEKIGESGSPSMMCILTGSSNSLRELVFQHLPHTPRNRLKYPSYETVNLNHSKYKPVTLLPIFSKQGYKDALSKVYAISQGQRRREGMERSKQEAKDPDGQREKNSSKYEPNNPANWSDSKLAAHFDATHGLWRRMVGNDPETWLKVKFMNSPRSESKEDSEHSPLETVQLTLIDCLIHRHASLNFAFNVWDVTSSVSVKDLLDKCPEIDARSLYHWNDRGVIHFFPFGESSTQLTNGQVFFASPYQMLHALEKRWRHDEQSEAHVI